jgi:hypothetical protein
VSHVPLPHLFFLLGAGFGNHLLVNYLLVGHERAPVVDHAHVGEDRDGRGTLRPIRVLHEVGRVVFSLH